jgi:hypothetical protein
MNRFINLKFASLLFLLLIPVIALSDLFDNKPTEEPEKIQWLADRPLTWADFKGDKDSIIYGQEEASVRSRVELLTMVTGDKIVFLVRCFFDPETSWTITSDSSLLVHEQMHFNLAEYYARVLRKKLSETEYFRSDSLKVKVTKMYQEVFDISYNKQQKYDYETKHSKSEIDQLRWNAYINSLLISLEAYSNPEIIVYKH